MLGYLEYLAAAIAPAITSADISCSDSQQKNAKGS